MGGLTLARPALSRPEAGPSPCDAVLHSVVTLLVHFHVPPVHLAPPFKFLEDSSSRISKSTKVFDPSDKCVEEMLTYAVLPLRLGCHKGKDPLSSGHVTRVTSQSFEMTHTPYPAPLPRIQLIAARPGIRGHYRSPRLGGSGPPGPAVLYLCLVYLFL